MIALLGEFDFARVKLSYAAYAVVFVDDRWGFALGFRQRQVNKVL